MPLGVYNHTLSNQQRAQDQREHLQNYQDRTSNLVEGIRDAIGPGNTGIQNAYTQNWDQALNNARQGAGDYLAAMQNGQGSVMQAQQRQGLGTLQAGLGNGMNRNAYMNAANRGSEGVAATSMGRAGETNAAMGNYGNTMFGVGAGYGGQASFQQGARQFANDQALQQQAAYQGQDATQTNQAMSTGASIAGMLGAGAMMMSDARAKEEAYAEGHKDGQATSDLAAYSAAEVAKARGVPMLNPEHTYPNIKNTNPYGVFHYGDADPQAQTSPVIAQLAQKMGVDPKNIGRDLQGNDIPIRMVPKPQVPGRVDPPGFVSPWEKQKADEQHKAAWENAVGKLGEVGIHGLDAAKEARVNAIGLGSGELGHMPVSTGTVDAPAFIQPTPEILDKYKLGAPPVVEQPSGPPGAVSSYNVRPQGIVLQSDAKAKVLADENASLKAALALQTQYSVGPGGISNFETPKGQHVANAEIMNVAPGSHVLDFGFTANNQIPLQITRGPEPEVEASSIANAFPGTVGPPPQKLAFAPETVPSEKQREWQDFIAQHPEADEMTLSDMGVKKAATSRLKKELYKRGEMAVDSDIGRAHDDIMKALKPHAYSYKDNADPKHIGALPAKQVRPGITAQELEKSDLGKTLVINTPKGKMIDIPALTGANSAMIARLYEHISKLEGRHGKS